MSDGMEMSDEEKAMFVEEFLSESDEHIQKLNELLLKAEEIVNAGEVVTPEDINTMFRAAHTVKGTSAMLGFMKINSLTHEMETVLDRIRNNQMQFTAEAMDVLFSAFDTLSVLMERLKTEGNDEGDIEESVAKIKAVLDGKAVPAAPKESVDAAPTGSEESKKEDKGNKVKAVEVVLKPAANQPESKELDETSKKYLAAFIEEADQSIETFSEILLEIEEGKKDPKHPDELFRLMHTIKGSAGVIGRSDIGTVSHKCEDLLSDFRQGKGEISANHIALLLNGVDWINAILGYLKEGNIETIDVAPIVSAFESGDSGDTSSKADETSAKEPAKAPAQPDTKTAVEPSKSKATASAQKTKTPAPAGKGKSASLEINTMRIDARKLDLLMNLAGELVIARARVGQIVQDVYQELSRIRDISGRVPELQNWSQQLKSQVRFSDVNGNAGNGSTAVAATHKLEKVFDKMEKCIGDMASDTAIKGLGSAIYALDEATNTLGKLSSDIQSGVMQTRMIPVEGTFSRFKRVVRDLAKSLDKDIKLEIEGEETELDKKIIDELGDPLTHMIRNAVDHGIETKERRAKTAKSKTGTVKLRACHKGNNVCIEISDDGAGLDSSKLVEKAIDKGILTTEQAEQMNEKEKLNIIFMPGFSTAAAITGVSGRGVGMDVVKSMIESVKGTVDIETELGRGTTMSLKIPLTLAIIEALLVIVNDQNFAIPLETVNEIIEVKNEEIYSIDGMPTVKLRGHALSLVELETTIRSRKSVGEKPVNRKVVVVTDGDQSVGLLVDTLIGEEEIVIKALSQHFADVKGISGASILGNGKVSLILDIPGTIRLSQG